MKDLYEEFKLVITLYYNNSCMFVLCKYAVVYYKNSHSVNLTWLTSWPRVHTPFLKSLFADCEIQIFEKEQATKPTM